ncbi:hypothetical protein GCM10010412_082940 [Nonomuraea recticatena]|uniref:Uncharacterized protein n=1 Tax=Nonomuraea recticatena TaxID=46178 RepID=A0ABN3T2Z3_9ACTN
MARDATGSPPSHDVGHARPSRPSAPKRAEAGDRYARFLELNRPGVLARDLAEQLGVSKRTVERYRRAIPPSPTPDPPKDAPTVEPAASTPLSRRQRQRLGERTLQAALNLALLVRDEDSASCQAFVQSLPQAERDALPYILAALVPVDRPASELLEWITWDERGRPIGPQCQTRHVPATPATAKRHRDHGEQLCPQCREAEQRYRRNLYLTSKSRKRAAA